MTVSTDAREVLVVDDDPVVLELLRGQLLSAGYQPLTASGGPQAVEILTRREPRIVVTDWIMPEMDGLELCRWIRTHFDGRFVYVVMLTVRSEKARLMEAFEAGVDDFLSKPFHEGELLSRIRAGARMVRIYDEEARNAAKLRRLNEQLLKANVDLRRMASTDELTGLLNRRQVLVLLEQLWATTRRYDRPFAGAIADIDHFKRLNDLHGHPAGDEVLRQIGALLSGSVRQADCVGRLGGEEFLVLLPDQTAEGALAWAERFRELVEALRSSARVACWRRGCVGRP